MKFSGSITNRWWPSTRTTPNVYRYNVVNCINSNLIPLHAASELTYRHSELCFFVFVIVEMNQTSNKWTRNVTKTKWKRSREIGRYVIRIQWNPKRLKRTFFVLYVCVCALFVSLLSTELNKDVSSLWMSAYVCTFSCFLACLLLLTLPHVYSFASWFYCFENRNSAEKKNLLTKWFFSVHFKWV